MEKYEGEDEESQGKDRTADSAKTICSFAKLLLHR